jgi:hypothetical protein
VAAEAIVSQDRPHVAVKAEERGMVDIAREGKVHFRNGRHDNEHAEQAPAWHDNVVPHW